MPTIVHFEIPSDDIERSKKFYNDLFGWKFEKFPSPPDSEAMPQGMEYWIISTVDDKGNEALNGGLMKRQSPQQQGITNYFDVKSVQEYSAKVEQLEAKLYPQKCWCQVWVIWLHARIQRIMALMVVRAK
jgi:predicted enzyme related to lactoylglutathione lyase